MPRELTERIFGAALANEFQWRNLYLKEFGCCTYPPPIPKDPCTTSEGVFPLQRQVSLLPHESSSSSDGDADDNQTDSNYFNDTSTATIDTYDPAQGQQGTMLLTLPVQAEEKHESNAWKPHPQNGRPEDAETPRKNASRGARPMADQYFSLDMSLSLNKNASESGTGHQSSHRNGQRRNGHGTVLRKDDFFDSNDVFSTKFFSFLWTADESHEENTDVTRADDNPNHSSPAYDSAKRPAARRNAYDTNYSKRLTLSRAGFSAVVNSTFKSNPHDLPKSVLLLHHQTWALLMDNRLMAWVHREAAEHCQRATVLRQRLLDIIASGPTRIDGIAFTFSESTSSSLLLPQEDTLQRTLESFSPFFVVVSPPAVVQRVRDHIHAARQVQGRSGSGHRSNVNAAADLIGLPLLSQYGSWREAYEHRSRWNKAPFSFFLIHDVSYNYAQVTAFFVELQLLYTHSHIHSRNCLEARRTPVPLQKMGQPLSNLGAASPTTAEQSNQCPLLFMGELTEAIILAYEQSPAHTTLSMLRRVLDFLTDAALDVLTAYRFISSEALQRQHQFEVPGVTITRQFPAAPSIPTAFAANISHEVAAEVISDTAHETDSDVASVATGSDENLNDNSGISGVMDSSHGGNKIDNAAGNGSSASIPHIEPRRVTEHDINALFEIAYWFVDATTANNKVPLDPTLLAGIYPGGRGVASSMFPTLNADGSQSILPHNTDTPPPTETENLSALPIPQSQQYLPGRAQVHNPVGSLAEAVTLLEAYRYPFKPRDDKPIRGARKRRQGGAQGDAKARRRGNAPKKPASPHTPAVSFSNSFRGFISPLVILTTYIRMHGGIWLKQLFRHVFELLRKPGILLYVNTLELDATWASLQSPPPLSTQENVKQGDTGGARGRLHRPRPSVAVSAATASPALGTAAEADTNRSDFFYGLKCLEDLICQDILYSLNHFFGFLYGKRSPAARLPNGISLLLTQFVSTVHLYMLESVGVTRAGVFGETSHNSSARPGGRAQPKHRGINTTDETPTRIVEECLRVCKQRYQASVRRGGGSGDPNNTYMSAFRNPNKNVKGTGSSTMAEEVVPTAVASVSRLLQTIEQHRLAKFIIFDCWILPALNNAVSFGYLAPDSPMHLRWNVDALARYLKILLHAPFVENDKKNFTSLSSRPLIPSRQGSQSDLRPNASTENRDDRGAEKRQTRNRAGHRGNHRGAVSQAVLTLPAYITGIYDVATGSLVRMQTSLSVATTKRSKPSQVLRTPIPNAETVEPPPVTQSISSLMSSSPLVSTVADKSVVSVTPSVMSDTEDTGSRSDMKSPTQSGQSKGTLEATAPPPSHPATFEGQSEETPLKDSVAWGISEPQAGATAAAATTALPQSVISSRLLSSDGGIAEVVPHPNPDRGVQDDAHAAPPNEPRSDSQTTHSSKIQSSDSLTASSLSTDNKQNPLTNADASNRGSVPLTHPYVVMDDAGWVDMSPVLQSLNDSIGLTSCDRGISGALNNEANSSTSPSHLPKTSERGGVYWSRKMSTMASGAKYQSPQESVGNLATTTNSSVADLPVLHMLNAFIYTACTDNRNFVLVPEHEILPSMVANCIEKLYDFATDKHPMVVHALSKGFFDFSRNLCDSTPSGLTSLYMACMNGVLLHPRTASHVLKNVMENNALFSRTLLKPVTDTTALELLGSLVSCSRDMPMVDVNAVVPLIHSLAPSRAARGGSMRRLPKKKDAACGGVTLPAISPKDDVRVSTSAVVSHRWERESRRLLREFVFLTNGNDDSGPPQPLVPGFQRPIGPPHPGQIIQAGAARIVEDTGGGTPMVFDPWWRAMVVALCVKAFNMFAECTDAQSASFEEICHDHAEEANRLNRYVSSYFVTTKGKETFKRNSSTGVGLQGRQSFTGRGSITNSMIDTLKISKRKAKSKKAKPSGGGVLKSPGLRAKKQKGKSPAAAM